MGILDELSGVLQQYGSGAGASQAPAEVHDHFDQVAQAAPQGLVAEGLAAAFRSDQTPDFGQLLGNLFNQSSGDQKAGMLNQLLATAGPGVLASLGGSGGLASLLQGGSVAQITPEQAAQVSPEAVQQLASHAEKADPSIIDRASQFYAEHPALIKTLGGAVLSVALATVAQKQSQR
jgi:hypothetical protein